MLHRTDYDAVRELARDLVSGMEAICCGFRDGDGRQMADEARLMAAAETTVARIATLVMTSQIRQD